MIICNRRLRSFLIGLSFIVLVSATGCHKHRNQTIPNEIAINLADEPHVLDPRRARDLNSISMMKALFEGLTRMTPSQEAALALALGVEISLDQKVYTFHLRKSTWSNGDPVTADDFVYAWKKVLDPTFLSDNAFQLYVIEGAKEVKEGKKPADALSAIALDAQTLEVTLKDPTPYFLELLAHPVFYPVHALIDQTNPTWADEAFSYVSNGPFRLAQWKHHDHMKIEKNPLYWDSEHVYLDAIEMLMVTANTEFRLFQKGKLHWAGSPFSEIVLEALEDARKHHTLTAHPIASTSFLRVNVQNPFLANPKIRRALALAINRKEIIDHVLQEKQPIATGLIPPQMRKKSCSYFEDGAIRQAQELFKQALSENNLTVPAQLHLMCTSVEKNRLIAQAIQENWRKHLGLTVVLEPMEKKVYFNRLSRQDYTIALGSWFADFADPVNFLGVFLGKQSGSNNTNWENQEYMELVDASYQEIEVSQRDRLLFDAEALLIDEMPIIPLYHGVMSYVKNEHLKGVFLSNLGDIDFKSAYLDNAQ